MIYFAGLIGLVILAAMIYMALNKQSNFQTRVASLIALAVMIAGIIICLFIVLLSDKAPPDESIVLVGIVKEAPKTENNNVGILLLFIIFLLALFVLIAFLSLRNQKKSKPF
jgi:heme A synthase